jgi:hypothetical protein
LDSNCCSGIIHGLEKVHVEAFADVFQAKFVFMDMLLPMCASMLDFASLPVFGADVGSAHLDGPLSLTTQNPLCSSVYMHRLDEGDY